MKSKNCTYNQFVGRTIYIISLMLIFCTIADSQVFQLGIREYRFEDSKWFNYSSGRKGDTIVPNRLIVRMASREKPEPFHFNNLGISEVNVVSRRLLADYYIIEINSNLNPFEVAETLFRSSYFDYVEFDALGSYAKTPSDPEFSNQWNLDDTKLRMEKAWDITSGDNSVILAILDSGTEYDHEDLDNNIWNNSDEQTGDGNSDGCPGVCDEDDDGDGLIDEDSEDREPGDPGYSNDLYEDDDENSFIDDFVGWDFQEDDNDPEGTYYHGTVVAGIAGAQTHNYEGGAYRGVSGIAGGWGTNPGVSLMILRIRDYPFDWQTFASSAAECITYAAENGADVMNMSFGWFDHYPWFEDIVNEAADDYDCIMVACSHNDGGSIRYPAKYAKTIAVGATDDNDVRRSYSNYGPELDVVAPSHVPTTTLNNDYVDSFSGTSAASPHVAGLAALIRSISPNLSWDEVRDIIRDTADKAAGMGGQDFTNYYGYGRVNAYEAIKYTLENYGGTLTQGLTIPSGETWDFKEGVTLKFPASKKLQVYGTLIAEGTSGSHIKFTKSGSSYWYGIQFENSSVDDSCIIKYADVEYATYGINCIDAKPAIKYNNINNVTWWGVYALRESPSIQYNTISNTIRGVYCRYSGSSVYHNTISNCSWGVYLLDSGASVISNTINNITNFGVYINKNSPTIQDNTISDAQRGVYCKNTGLSIPVIKNNTVSNCDYGIYCYSSNPKIWNNTSISGCDYGIYLISSSSPEIITNLIENNTRGIYANGSSSNLYIRDNRITGNGMQVGLELYDTSEPVVKLNTITGDEMSWGNWGIKADFYSGFQSGGSCEDGYNRIILEGIDIADIRTLRANNHSYMEIGDGEDHGKNAIYGESYGDKSAGVEAYVHSDIYAQKNWWGRYPPVGFLSDGTSSIDRSNPLDYDPGGGSSLDKAIGTVVALEEPVDTNSVASLWAWGRQMLLEERFEEASEIFKILVRKFSFSTEAHWALVRIVTLYRKSQVAGLAEYLIRLITNSSIDSELQMAARELLVSTYKRNGQFDNAIQVAEGIISLAPNTRHEYHALFNLFNIYDKDLEDSTAAADILLRLKSKYPDYELTQIAQFDMGEDVYWSLAKGFDGIDKPYVNDMAFPEKFRLGTGYPNPFNPITTITYDLPDDAQVSLVVYDILGREVARLVDGFVEPGYHQVEWDGKDQSGRLVPTGIYLYRLVATSLESSEHFTASRKLVLMK